MTETEKLAERLKVAEELYANQDVWSPPVFLGDIVVNFDGARMIALESHCGRVVATIHPSEGMSLFSQFVDCVLAARAKLREEAEAAMTPEVRKLRKALEEVVDMTHGAESGTWCRRVYEVAEKALES